MITEGKSLIIYVHPYDKSFNHAIYDKILENHKGGTYSVIDLYKDRFNPVYDVEELALFKNGQTNDPLVKKYQELILLSDEIIIITPIWWNDIPVILKGFFDKVFKQNFAYVNAKIGVSGKLQHIKKVMVITTATSQKFYLKFFAGNCIGGTVKTTFRQVGVNNFKWIHLGNIGKSTPKKRENFLNHLNV